MRIRSLAVTATALATLGLALTASAAPHSRGHQQSSRIVLEGVVLDWDAAAPSITLEEPEVHGGRRAARRALRALAEVEVAIGPRTRIIAEDDEGFRDRITADELFAELEASADDLDAEVVVVPSPAPGRPAAAIGPLTAKKVVLHLPGLDQEDDPGDEDPAPAEDLTEPGLDDGAPQPSGRRR